nr:hypothetical protein Iba_chr12cCG8160 [Ipomoea batatas]GMD72187.1 hypothetical protein Iba_chr12fCG6180 [Ipomoea batatas]
MVSLSSGNFLLRPMPATETQEKSRQSPPPAAASGSNGGVATSVGAVGDVGIRMVVVWWGEAEKKKGRES